MKGKARNVGIILTGLFNLHFHNLCSTVTVFTTCIISPYNTDSFLMECCLPLVVLVSHILLPLLMQTEAVFRMTCLGCRPLKCPWTVLDLQSFLNLNNKTTNIDYIMFTLLFTQCNVRFTRLCHYFSHSPKVILKATSASPFSDKWHNKG